MARLHLTPQTVNQRTGSVRTASRTPTDQAAATLHAPRSTFASLFFGTARLDLGLHRRMRCTLMAEVEKHPRAIVSQHFPNTPPMEEVRNVI